MNPMNNKHSFFSIQFNISSKFYDRLILTNQISIEKIEKSTKTGSGDSSEIRIVKEAFG